MSPDTQTPWWRRRPTDVQLVTVGLVLLGAWGFAGSTTHVLHLAREHGAEGWLAWNVAGAVEFLVILAGWEIRLRARLEQPALFPKGVIALAVLFVVGANLVQADTLLAAWVGWGYIVAVVPPVCFLGAAGLIETRPGHRRRGAKAGKSAVQPASPARTAQQPSARPSAPTETPKPAERRTAAPDVVGKARGAKGEVMDRLLTEGRAARAAGQTWKPDIDALMAEHEKSRRSIQVYVQTARQQLDAEEAAA